ncbi:MAG TPA: long-chain fatty acid--CoA ligase [Streptosporangiaceae bacterium]|nr:long-chain fatty acid--CoA ligase [Streptosporangiaceae bacterium]
MREYSNPALSAVPATARLTDVVADRAQRDPGKVVLRRKAGQGWPPAAAGGQAGAGTWVDVTARQFADEVGALAKGLIAAGIAAGDRVALLSRTRYEWTLADYAIWTAGAVTVPVYETSSPEQVEWILSDSAARAIIVETPAHEAAIADVLKRLPSVELCWLIEGGSDGQPGYGQPGYGQAGYGQTGTAASLTALAAEGAVIGDNQLEQRRTGRSASDPATIIYTSGTTGKPKGCELTHANLLADVRNALAGPLSPIFDVAGASTLLFLPLAHVFARVIQVGCLEEACILGHTPDPTASKLLPDLASFQPTFLLAVPRVFEKVYNGAEQQAAASPVKGPLFRAAARTAISYSEALDGPGEPALGLRLSHGLFDHLVYGKLRAAVGGRAAHAVSGGAPLGERLGHFFRGAGITILEGYGLTETTAAATVNPPGANKIGTVGQPLPGVGIRIADDGEVLIKGPNVFAGYWHNETATKDTLTVDGWFRTGDLGELDDGGYLRVTGRKKELIVTAGGKNVAPAVLEDRIRAHPLVSQCMVVGDGRPYVACLITLDEESLGPWLARHPRAATSSIAELATDAEIIAEIQAAVDDGNQAVSRAEQIKRFRILPADFTEAAGYLTPSLKVRRTIVAKDFAAEIEALYQ